MILKKIKSTDDQRIGFVVAIVFFGTPILVFINAVTNLFYPNQIDTLTYRGGVLLVILYAVPAIAKRLKMWDYIFVSFIALLYILNFLIFPQNDAYLTEIAKTFFPIVLPSYLLGRALWDVESVINCIRPVATVAVICSVITQFIWYAIEYKQIDNMSFAYSFLPCALFFVYEVQRHRQIRNTVMCILAIGILLLAGTRGPLVCLISFVGFCILLNIRKSQHYLLLALVAVFGVYFQTSNFYTNMLTGFNNWLISQRLNNRITYMLINSEFTQSRERLLLKEIIINYTNSAGILGRGIGADRVVLGGYVHNLIYEIWCHYGYVIGSILILIVIVILLNGLLKSKNSIERYFFGILFCSSVVKLFISSSYLLEPLLWLLFGFCVSIRVRAKRNEELEGKYV